MPRLRRANEISRIDLGPKGLGSIFLQCVRRREDLAKGKGVRCEAEYEERLVQAGCDSILDRYESLRLCGSTAVY